MPAQQKLYEGPSLEVLLEEINGQLGPDARIVRAEKVRHGGVLGFFAREEYRLTVQAPPAAKKAPARTARRDQTAGRPAPGRPAPGRPAPGRATPHQSAANAAAANLASARRSAPGASLRHTAHEPPGRALEASPSQRAATDAAIPAARRRPPAEPPADAHGRRPARRAAEASVPQPVSDTAARVGATAADATPGDPFALLADATADVVDVASAGTVGPLPSDGTEPVAGPAPSAAAAECSAFDALVDAVVDAVESVDEAVGHVDLLGSSRPGELTVAELWHDPDPDGDHWPGHEPLDDDGADGHILDGQLVDRELGDGPTPGAPATAGGPTGQAPARLRRRMVADSGASAAFAGSFEEVLRRVATALDDDPYPADPAAVVVDSSVTPPIAMDRATPEAPVLDDSTEPEPPGPSDVETAPLGSFGPTASAPSDQPSRPAAARPRRMPAHAASVVASPAWTPLAPWHGDTSSGASVGRPAGLTTQAVLMADRLRAAGLPASDVERVVGAVADGRRFGDLLVDLFCRLPAPPPLPVAPGSVVAVVGALAPAVVAARSAAVELGVDPSSVVALTPAGPPPPALGNDRPRRRGTDSTSDRRHPGPASDMVPVHDGPHASPTRPDAPADRPGLDPSDAHTAVAPIVQAIERRRAAGLIQIVVVECALAGPSRSWAAHTLAQLRPDAVWGAVAAMVKPEDIAAWATGLGGVDALAVDDIAATVSPAAVLRTGVPVARLDGDVATPERWAAAVGALVAA